MADEGTEQQPNGAQQGDPKDGGKDTQKQTNADAGKGPNGNAQTPFGELDTDTTEWLTKREVKDIPSLIKLARDKDKMVGEQATKLGAAIIRPGKDATDGEKAAYREKMGLGASPEDYVFDVPKDLPEGLPYDGERAKSFAALAVEQELSKKQAQAIHDWAVKNSVDDFTGAAGAEQAQKLERAKGETAKLVKLYGPVDGEQFRAQAAFADKALSLEPEAAQRLEEIGVIADVNGQKIVQDAVIFNLFAKVGSSLFKEGEVLRGNSAQIGNPFMDGEQENVTEQGRLINKDRPRALALIAAAGKKPSDFGLQV